MAKVFPFKALRPAVQNVKQIASYPYDVINSQEARKLAENNPLSFLHVVKSEIDLSESTDVHAEAVYNKAKENLRLFINDGTMIQDDKACFYIYRQIMGDHEQYGIVGCVDAHEYETGKIKKHELTLTEKEADRTHHIDVLNAQTGPIFLTYKTSDTINGIVEEIVKTVPLYDFVADDGIGHTVWKVNDNQSIADIENSFSNLDALYIADGHHRTASAATVARIRKERNPLHQGTEEYNHIMAVIFPHGQLKILDYNRVVRDLNGLGETGFIRKIAKKFAVSENYSDKSPANMRDFGMYLNGCWYKLTAKESTFDEHDVIETLDVSILQNNLLRPVLGIQDVRTDPRIHCVGGIRGMKELERLVDSGEYAVAFSLYPTNIEQLIDVADAGKIMPPKSTWFEPKLRSGIFVHLFEE